MVARRWGWVVPNDECRIPHHPRATIKVAPTDVDAYWHHLVHGLQIRDKAERIDGRDVIVL